MQDNLFSWHGRINRKVFIIRSIVLFIIGFILGLLTRALAVSTNEVVSAVLGIFSLPLMWIGIVNNIKRLHDMGYSGWIILVILLLALIPILGAIIALAATIWLFCIPGQKGPNKYGEDPLALS